MSMKNFSDKEFGALGEKLAAVHLKKKHYKILEKNYKIKGAELDIVACNKERLVFAEVKTRSADPYLRGMYAVDRRKQEHILRAASAYMRENKDKPEARLQPRFDVIEIEIDRSTGKQVKLTHFENAFMQTGDYARY